MSEVPKDRAIVFRSTEKDLRAMRRRYFWREVRQMVPVVLFGVFVLALVWGYLVVLGDGPIGLGKGL